MLGWERAQKWDGWDPRWLLLGANVSAEDGDGDTALHLILLHLLGSQRNNLDGSSLEPLDMANAPNVSKVQCAVCRL